MNRRSFLQLTTITSGSIIMGKMLNGCDATSTESSIASDISWFMPDESAEHLCTWMAFGASREIWGRKLLPEVQDNLAAIARAIVQYEPVKMLVREEDYDIAREKCGSDVELIICPLDDLWIRDTGPVFVVSEDGQKAGVDFNFNGWGEKQEVYYDAEVASFVTEKSNVPLINTDLVLEGGGIEVDGEGTAIITESCVLNDNRNPGWSKADCEAELKVLLGLEKIIWLPGIAGFDITDGHTDFYARFTQPGVVVAGFEPDPDSEDHEVTKEHIEILQSATDADGEPLEVIVLEGPKSIRPGYPRDEFAAGYINFYVINGAVIAPEFGDAKADSRTQEILAELFPDRDIVPINIDAIAAGGGGIHCATQQEPKIG